MSEKIVTTADLIAEVRKIAEAEPDYTYNADNSSVDSCSYFGPSVGNTEGNPCIVGKALRNLGVDTSKLLDREKDGFSDRIKFVLDYQFVPVVSLVPRESLWLESVQQCQDDGDTWSEAVSVADRLDGLYA